MSQRTASSDSTARRRARGACAILLGTALASACTEDLQSPTYGDMTTGAMAGPTTGGTNATSASTGTTGGTVSSTSSASSTSTGTGGSTSTAATVTGSTGTTNSGNTTDGEPFGGNTDGGGFNCDDVGDACCNGAFCFGDLDCEGGVCVEEDDDGDGGAAGAAGAGSQ